MRLILRCGKMPIDISLRDRFSPRNFRRTCKFTHDSPGVLDFSSTLSLGGGEGRGGAKEASHIGEADSCERFLVQLQVSRLHAQIMRSPTITITA